MYVFCAGDKLKEDAAFLHSTYKHNLELMLPAENGTANVCCRLLALLIYVDIGR